MKCGKCGVQIPDNSVICPHCRTKTAIAKETPAQPKYKKPIVIAMVVLAVLALAALILASVFKNRQSDITYAPSLNPAADNSVLGTGRNQQSTDNVMGIAPPEPPSGNVMQAPQPPPLPNQQTPPNVTKPKPPQYVVDYLMFVKGVEEHRQKLLKDTQAAFAIGAATKATGGLDALLNMLDDTDNPGEVKDPMEDSKKELMRQYQNWYNTLAYFNSRQPPEECKEFAGYYQMVLYYETASIYDVIKALSSATDYNKQQVTQIVTALQGILKNGAQQNIDTAVEYADTALTNLVSNYDMEKPFNVTKEQGAGGSLLGF